MEARRRLTEEGRTLNEVVAAAIRADIITGRYAPGDRLAEERLATEHSVSRNPIREAIRRLESEGFVEVLPNRGATVGRVDERQAQELLQVRSALETLVIGLAAHNRTDEHLSALRSIVAAGCSAAAEDRLEELAELNAQFHATLAAASGNSTLAGIIRQLRDKIAWVYASKITVRAEDSWSEHAAMLDALEAGDEERVVELMRMHIANAETAYEVRHPG
ncbi:MAG: GntR family transcriptional regulator [Acidimicrobiales bacterium]